MFELDPQTVAYIQAYLFEAGKIVAFWELCRAVAKRLLRNWKTESKIIDSYDS